MKTKEKIIIYAYWGILCMYKITQGPEKEKIKNDDEQIKEYIKRKGYEIHWNIKEQGFELLPYRTKR